MKQQTNDGGVRESEKARRRSSRQRNLAHKNSPYKKKGHKHATLRDYHRPQKRQGGVDLDTL